MDKDFSIGDSLSAGWETTRDNLGLLIAVQLVSAVLCFTPMMIGEILLTHIRFAGVFFLAAAYALQFFVMLGMVKLTYKLAAGEDAAFADMFSQLHKLPVFLGASILFYALLFIGFLLLIIPGVILMLGYCFYPFVIVIDEAGVVDSLKRSWKITQGVRWKILGFLVLFLLLMAAGTLFCGVGVLITGPIAFIAWARIFQTLSDQTPASGLPGQAPSAEAA